MSLWHRRWRAFCSNRRAFWSLWIFIGLFCVAQAADLLANDRPLLIHSNQQLYFPMLVSYPETEFGGFLPTEADYQDPFVRQSIEQSGGWMIPAPIPFSPDRPDTSLQGPVPSAPDSRHWLGTDDQGRDVLARLIHGARISLNFGLCLSILGTAIGVFAGALQGYYGGLVDLIGQRLVEIWNGLPVLFVLILISSLILPGFWTLLGIMLLFGWTSLVGLVRAEFLRGRNMEYVLAARAQGVGDVRIILRHILPNALVATLSFLPFQVSGAIVALTSLDFLGFGLPPGTASLGELLAQGKTYLHAPWLGLSVFVTLSLLLSLLVFVGEGARDAFDQHRAPLGGAQM